MTTKTFEYRNIMLSYQKSSKRNNFRRITQKLFDITCEMKL